MSHWIETQDEWTSQPQVPVKATSNPIKWDRVWDLGQFREAVSNGTLTNSNTTPFCAGEKSRNIGGTNQNDDTHYINTGASIAGHGITNSFTFVIRVVFASNGWAMVSCGDESSTADDGAIQFFRLVGGDLVFRTSDSGGTAKDINLTGGGVLNKLLTVVMTYNGAAVKAWLNGTYVGTVAMTGNVRSTTSNFFLGKRGASGTSFPYPLDGWISLSALSKQAVPDAYAAELSLNPWQIFEPEDDTIWVPSAGGVSAALTGQAGTVTLGSLTAEVTAPLTGQNVSLAQGTVVVDPGGVTAALTGQAVSAELGSFSAEITAPLTGQSITISQGTLVPALESAITGQSASVALGSMVGAVAPALTGHNIPLAQGTLVAAVVSAITGQSASFAQGTVVVDTGGVIAALTGQAISAGLGNFGVAITMPLTGYVMGLSQGDMVAVYSAWVPVSPASSSWSDVSGTAGGWTDQTPASGSWTVQ